MISSLTGTYSLQRRLVNSALYLCVVLVSVDFEAMGMQNVSVLHKGILLITLIVGTSINADKRWSAIFVPCALIVTALCTSLMFGNVNGYKEAVDSSLRGSVLLVICVLVMAFPISSRKKEIHSILTLIQLLPILCVLFGIMSIPFGGAVFRVESGILRLTGFSSPAHLGMLCFISASATCLKQNLGFKPVGWGSLILVGIILILTGARTAMLVSLIVVLPLSRVLLRLRTPTQVVINIFAILLGVGGGAAAIYKGFERSYVNGIRGFDTSGRFGAWDFFYQRFLDSPIFGHGLGSVLDMHNLTTDWRIQFFSVPHNEYLRFLVDLGLFGSLLIFLSQWSLIAPVVRRASNKFWLLLFLLGHLIYSGFDNTYGTLQYLVGFFLLMRISIVMSSSKNYYNLPGGQSRVAISSAENLSVATKLP